MLDVLDNYDWAEVFSFTNDPEAVPPGAVMDEGGFDREDVVEVLGMDDGENDGPSWVGAFKLKDGRFAFVDAGCDYTGWDCQAGGHSVVASSLDDLLRFGLTEGEKARLGLKLE